MGYGPLDGKSRLCPLTWHIALTTL